MNKIIYVCSFDSKYREYVKNEVQLMQPSAKIIDCKNRKSLYKRIRKFRNAYIICDTLFLGLILSLPLSIIRCFLNASVKVLLTTWQNNCFYLGLRIKNLGFDGFIKGIGDTEKFKDSMKEFLCNGTYFDYDIRQEFNADSTIKNKDYSRYIVDITTHEIETVLNVRKFGNTKHKDGSYDSNAYNQISCFKMKLGIETDEELDEVIHLMKKGLVM